MPPTSEVHPVSSIDIAEADTADLAAFGDAVGSARVVLLGEAGHLDGAAFALKARLVRFLHEECGFDVLAWEAGNFDCWRMGKALATGSSPRDELMKLHSGVWASREVLALLEYVAASASTERSISSAGFDCQFASPDSTEALRAFLARVVPEMDGEARDQLARAAGAGRMAPALDDPARESLDGLLEQLRALVRHRSEHSDASQAVTEELRVLEGVIDDLAANADFTRAREPWMTRVLEEAQKGGGMELDLADPELQRMNQIRDAAMGANLARLAEDVFPGRRIVGWLSTAHAALDLGGVDAEGGGYRGWTSAGGVARGQLGDALYSVGITAHHGETGVGPLHEVRSLKAPSADSIEAILNNAAAPHAFASLQDLPADHVLRGTLRSRLLDNEERLASDWGEVVDGVFLVDEMRVPSPLST